VVESLNKQTRVVLQDGIPGYNPPGDAQRRQGKHYDNDACLSLQEFTAIILREIIAHNRKPRRNYDYSRKELADRVDPSPIGIWRHNIVERTGQLTRYSEEKVRLSLLPRSEATVTEEGILFRGCLYSSGEAVVRGWFIRARTKRFRVDISFDLRLVDTIYVRTSRGVFVCALTSRSEKYRGLSFSEVQEIQEFQKELGVETEQARLQVMADYHEDVGPVIYGAKERLKKAGPKSRSSRRADTKPAREKDRRKERQEIAAPAPQPTTGGKIIQFPGQTEAATPAPANQATKPESSLEETMRLMRERMING
jgi:hypothetical protein